MRIYFSSLATLALLPCLCLSLVQHAHAKAAPAHKLGVDRQAAARKIDRLVEAKLDEKHLEALPVADDEQFVRRVYLDAIGRIPTFDETRAFLASDERDRRGKLIRDILKSPGHTSHEYNYWADILRVKDSDDGVGRAFYVLWIKDSIASNKPYDKFVRELITASGCGWEKGCGAVGYYLRDRAMPLDNMANTMRIFAGTRIACAQCHDHPSDKWTRRQMFEMAAFTSNVLTLDRSERFIKIVKAENAVADREMQRTSQMIRNTFYRDRVFGTSNGKIKLPADYQYGDAKPGATVSAHALFEPTGLVMKEKNPDYRQRFGDWLTSPANPRFTQVIANRLWKRVMRRGLVEPVDDIQDDSKATHPELLAYLTQLMKELHYDVRAYYEILYSTQTYQRAVDPDEPAEGESNYYRGHLLARMSAEQVWDSLLTLAVPNVDTTESGLNKATIYYEGKPVFVGKKDMYTLYSQVKNNTPEQHWKFLTAELKKIKDELNARMESAKAAGKPAPSYYNYTVRASELTNPAPRNHFLRTFGQSTREFIEGGNTASNVTQFLSMFNGLAEQQVLQRKDSELRKRLEGTPSASEACDVAYLSILSRLPTDKDRQAVSETLDSKDSKWSLDLAWALFNSQEFLFY